MAILASSILDFFGSLNELFFEMSYRCEGRASLDWFDSSHEIFNLFYCFDGRHCSESCLLIVISLEILLIYVAFLLGQGLLELRALVKGLRCCILDPILIH